MEIAASTSDEIIAKLKKILALDKIVKVFYVDDTVNYTGYSLDKVIGHIRDNITSLKKEQPFQELFGGGVDYSTDDDVIIFGQIENLVRTPDVDNRPIYSHLFPNEPLKKDDIEDDLKKLFDDVDFEPLHPKDAIEAFSTYFKSHTEGNIVFLFDFDFGAEMSTASIRNGGDLILKVCKDFPDKQPNMLFAIITHLVSQSEEIEKRDEYIKGDILKVKPIPFLLSKTRKTNQLLLADGIKKTLLNKLVEEIKLETLDVLEKAFIDTKGMVNKLDTYEFEQIVVKSSMEEGVWMGKTLRRLSSVLFENNIDSQMVKTNYLKRVNPIFESIIDYSLIHLISSTENKPYNNREFLRHSELYRRKEDINELYEPVANGDIFEIVTNNTQQPTTAHFILIGQDCDIILRSDGTRNRRQRFFSLLPITVISKAELNAAIIETAKEKKEKNHYMASRYLLPYYTPEDFKKVGVVNLTNELLVYIDVLDLVSINSDGEAKYDAAFAYKSGEFSHSLLERYNILVKICAKFNKEITGIESGISALGNSVKEKIRKKFIKRLSPISEDKGVLNPYLGPGKFDFGAKRISRLSKEYAAILLSKYTLFTSRPATNHDFAWSDQETSMQHDTGVSTVVSTEPTQPVEQKDNKDEENKS